MRSKTEQELFWEGEFGNEYIKRNTAKDWGGLQSAKISDFSVFLRSSRGIKTSLEFGGNIGLNEVALATLIPNIKMSVVEINETAAKQCSNIPNTRVYRQSIFDFDTTERFDLTFTCAVLIHINPDMLDVVYEKLYTYSSKYILIAEYYNPTPVEVEYRGNNGKLFKRDFAGEILDKYKDLELIDYGFRYYRGGFSIPVTDDLTWFLMEKTNK